MGRPRTTSLGRFAGRQLPRPAAKSKSGEGRAGLRTGRTRTRMLFDKFDDSSVFAVNEAIEEATKAGVERVSS
eukprot:4032915-Ditylum_brightwellii.AAC.1